MEQSSLFGNNEFRGNPNDKAKVKSKSKRQIKKDKEDFLKELIAVKKEDKNKAIEVNSLLTQEEIEVNQELEELNKELTKDAEEGLLVDEPFYVEQGKLFIKRFQNQIHPNLKNLAKSIIDAKWEQNIKVDNISIKHEVLQDDLYCYENIICVNQYGVRFNVKLNEVVDKLNKIPFEE